MYSILSYLCASRLYHSITGSPTYIVDRVRNAIKYQISPRSKINCLNKLRNIVENLLDNY
ncbi:hypothetical protein HZS_1161 [Henneguya salminicola]|nr:hypothetical protein HZS_1161 [Henneguya salminicola]